MKARRMTHPVVQIRSASFLPGYLLALQAIYCIASLVHFVHNAQFIAEYPNLPAWLTSSKVYLAWVAVTSVGAAGVAVALSGRRVFLVQALPGRHEGRLRQGSQEAWEE